MKSLKLNNISSSEKEGIHTLSPVKKLAACLLLALMLPIFFSGCKKEYINGDLDGFWQLEEITVDGQTLPYPDHRYWAFSFHVAQLCEYGGPFAIGNLAFDGSSVKVDFPYAVSEEDTALLREWGVYENPADYKVEQLNDKRLVMTCGDVRLRLRKM